MDIKEEIEDIKEDIDDLKEDIQETVEKLRTQRDDLNVRIHLAGMEVRDEWEALEKKWQEFAAAGKQLRNEVKPVMGDIHSAFSLLGEELAEGYKKIRAAL